MVSAACQKAPAVSVIMPVHNGEAYLAEAIDSILGQSFTDFELLIGDDGSTDGTAAIIEGYRQTDSRIRAITREKSGLAATLNELADRARGEWLARMDSDDVATPLRLEKQLNWLAQTGADICGSWARCFGTSQRPVLKHPQSDQAIKAALLFGSPFVHPTVVMRRQLLRELRYDGAWERAEDYDLWERAAREGLAMTNLPEVLLHYRMHPRQVSSDHHQRQLLLTQRIQRRYWALVLDALKLNHLAVEEVLKIRFSASPKPDMDQVDEVFEALLTRASGEAREALFQHVTKLYFRVAGSCPDCARRWSRLHRDYGSGRSAVVKMQLRLLSYLGAGAESPIFCRLKDVYFSLGR